VLGYFPVPYPDELFYGTVARLYQLLGKMPRGTFSKMVFGGRSITPGIIGAKHIDAFIKQLPPLARKLPGCPLRIRLMTLAGLLPTEEGKILLKCRKLPLTRAAIDRNTDTDMELAKKRVAWGLAQIGDSEMYFNKFCRLTSIRSLISDTRIKRMAEAALQIKEQNMV